MSSRRFRPELLAFSTSEDEALEREIVLRNGQGTPLDPASLNQLDNPGAELAEPRLLLCTVPIGHVQVVACVEGVREVPDAMSGVSPGILTELLLCLGGRGVPWLAAYCFWYSTSRLSCSPAETVRSTQKAVPDREIFR